MGTHWVQLAATDAGMLCAIFLSASRSLSALQPPDSVFAQSALRYKGDCIRSVNESISHEGRALSDATIAKTLALASDAVRFSKLSSSRLIVFAVSDGRPARV